MIGIIRELESHLRSERPRATRKADDFSRPYGIPFIVAGAAEVGRGANRIPVNWSEVAVQFSISPVVRPETGRVRKRVTA